MAGVGFKPDSDCAFALDQSVGNLIIDHIEIPWIDIFQHHIFNCLAVDIQSKGSAGITAEILDANIIGDTLLHSQVVAEPAAGVGVAVVDAQVGAGSGEITLEIMGILILVIGNRQAVDDGIFVGFVFLDLRIRAEQFEIDAVAV